MKKEISDEVCKTTYFIERSPRDGAYTLALEQNGKKQYILSKYNPRNSALEMLGDDWGNKSTVWVLVGFYFGYMLEELFRKVGKETKAIIVEPDKKLLDEQINLFNHKEVLNTENIMIITEEEIDDIEKLVNEFIPQSEFKNINVRFADGYLRYYNTFCNRVLNVIREFSLQCEISYNTALINEVAYIKNTIQNRKGMLEGYDLSKHKGKYKNIPALIVGAGPSLNKNIDEIKNFKGIIMGIGRTLSPLKKRGIKPDFVFSLDPTDLIYETFGDCKQYDTPLVTLGNANAKVVAGSNGPKYFMHNSTLSSRVLGLYVNPCLDLMGSVTTLCLSTARYMGCSPIVFVGQDLAFTENKNHSNLTLMQDDTNIDEEIVGETDDEIVKGYYGGSVKSNASWIAILRWIEYFIKHNDCEVYGNNEVKYINATEGGAYIEGMTHLSLRETIAKYCIHEKPTIEHEQLEENKDVDVEENLKIVYQSLRNISRAIYFGKIYYGRLLEEYVNNKGKKINAINKFTHKIVRVDKMISSMERAQEILKVMMEGIQKILTTSNASKEPIGETELQRKIRFVRLNYETYSRMFEASEMILDIIKGEIKE